MKKLTLLGGLTPAIFLREYWQKKPLLIRQAFPNFLPVMSSPELFSMAQRDDVESRFIRCSGKRWDLQHGPFTELPPTDDKKNNPWTLLVQGTNLHNAKADALLRQFRFISDSRLDDLMISYATDGGGVGAHVDSYDVFLLQAQGQRRWRISAQKDLAIIEGLPLKILQNFIAEDEYILEPGDMLYLPPSYAHEGVACGECMTYSIGFKAPAFQNLGETFLQFMAESIDLPGQYTDPDLAPSAHPARLDTAMLQKISEQLQKVRFTKDDITIFLGEYLSEPKANVVFESPVRPLTSARFAQACMRHGIALSLKTQMLYRGKHVFINGESFAIDQPDVALVSALADDRSLPPASISNASQDLQEAFYIWYQDGWLDVFKKHQMK